MSQVRVDIMLLITLLACLAAAITDLKRGIIPNRLVAMLLALGVLGNLGLALAYGLRGALGALWFSASGALVCALLPGALYAMKALGGGDLKLLIAIGACLGPRAGFQLQAYAYAFGSVYALVKVVFQGALWKTLYAGAASVLNPLLPRAYRRQTPLEGLTMCFGPAICLAAAALAVARWVLP